MSDFIGPPLPPEVPQRLSASQGADKSRNNSETICSRSYQTYGPSLPPQTTASTGPKLPPHEDKTDNIPSPECEIKTEAEPSSSYGPCLPPGFAVDDENTELRSEVAVESTIATVVGPALPPGFEDIQDEQEGDIIGPMPIMGGIQVVLSISPLLVVNMGMRIPGVCAVRTSELCLKPLLSQLLCTYL